MALSGAVIGGASAAINGGDGYDILGGAMLGFGAGMVVGAAPFALQGLFSGGGAVIPSVASSAASGGGGSLIQAASISYQAANLGYNLYQASTITQQYASAAAGGGGSYNATNPEIDRFRQEVGKMMDLVSPTAVFSYEEVVYECSFFGEDAGEWGEFCKCCFIQYGE